MPYKQFTDANQPPPLVTVIIVNYNGGAMVCRCLAALGQQQFQNFITVVVDNNSIDDSVSAIFQKYPAVKVLALKINIGFAGGVNHALRECRLGPLVALLNPDAFPSSDWLKNLVA